MQVSAKLNNLRIAPRKVRLVTELIKGLDVQDALNQLDVTVKGGSAPIKKLLLSAIGNGENNFGVDKDNMYILNILVEAGPTLKRWMPKAFGRAGQILKRTSKIKIILEERVEGKGRKSREQLEKEKQARLEERKKSEKEAEKERDKEEKSEDSSAKVKEKIKDTEIAKKAKEQKGSWGSKIFRRKSM